MTSQCTAQLLADLGVTRSLSRPQVSDDNPFSEAQFKTLKYHPSFPGRIFCLVLPLVQRRAPTRCKQLLIDRREAGAWAAHPDRFVSGEIGDPPPSTISLRILSQVSVD